MKQKPKVILYIAASLDGFIAEKNGSVKWLDKYDPSDKKEDYGYNKLINSVNTIIMGNKTYKQVLEFGPFPYKGKKCFVYSKKRKGQDKNTTFTKQSPKTLLKKLKGNIWLIGGAKIIKEFLKNNLIDEFIITITPDILSSGIPLFLNSKKQKHLTLVNTKKYKNGLVQLTYKK